MEAKRTVVVAVVLEWYSRALAAQPLLSWAELPRVFVVPLPGNFSDDLLKFTRNKDDPATYCDLFYLHPHAPGPVKMEYDTEVLFHWELLN